MKLGKYKHYKGKIYELVGLGRHSETLQVVVIYKDEYTMWVRPFHMWYDTVEPGVQRFTLIEE